MVVFPCNVWYNHIMYKIYHIFVDEKDSELVKSTKNC